MAPLRPGAAHTAVNVTRGRVPPPRTAEIEATIDALYDAAGDARLLPQAIEKVTSCLRSHRAFLLVRPSQQIAAAPLFGQPCNIAPEVLESLAGYWEGDPWSQGADRMGLRSGQVVVGEQLVDTEAFRRSAIFTDILCSVGMSWLLAGVADKTADDLVHMSVFRDDRRGPFDDHERKAMAALLPSLRVATRSVMQLQRCRLRAEALEDTLDSVCEAVFLVDPSGWIVTANAAAETLLAARSGLAARERRLVARCNGSGGSIAAMLHALATPGEAPQPLVIRDEFGRPALVLTAVPLRPAAQVRREAGQAGLPVAAIFATPTGTPSPAPATRLAAVYGLTPAEARLAEKLAAGASLSDIAEAQAITRETARSQLKAVYCKTDTHRQSELVTLVLSLGLAPTQRMDPGETRLHDSLTASS